MAHEILELNIFQEDILEKKLFKILFKKKCFVIVYNKMPSAWTEHVRKYAKDNNISYMCAISEASKTYEKKKKNNKLSKKQDNLDYNKHITPKLQNKKYKSVSAEIGATTRKENENLKKNKLDFARLILKNTDKENKVLLKDINKQLNKLSKEKLSKTNNQHNGFSGVENIRHIDIEKERNLLIYKRKALTGK